MNAERSTGEVLKLVKRRLHLIAAAAFVATSLACLVSFFLPRLYAVETRLEVGSIGTFQGAEYANRVQAVVDQIRSHDAFADVGRRLGLDSRFAGLSEIERNEKFEALLAQLRDRTDVELKQPANSIYTVIISHKSEDPDLAMKVVGGLGDYYQRLAVDQPSEQQQKTVEQAAKAERDAKESSDRASAEHLAYHNENREFLDGAAQKLQATRDEMSKIREITRPSLEKQLKELDDMLAQEKQFIIDKRPKADSSRLAGLDERIAKAREKLQQLTVVEKKTDAHPDVKAARQILEDLENDMKRLVADAPIEEVRVANPHWNELSKERFSVKGQLDIAVRSYERLKTQEKEQEELAKRTPEYEAKERSLADAKNSAQKEWETRAQDLAKAERALVDIRDRGTLAIRTLDPPTRPNRPSGPGALLLALVGFVVGAGAGVGVAVTLDAMDRSFREVDAVSEFLGVPTMGAIHAIRTPSEAAALRGAGRRKYAVLVLLAAVAGVLLLVALLGSSQTVRDMLKSSGG
jgi:capsular polysaccharide biosynthesis protein